ncbi:hypothetical protein CRG98_040637 [Punica granatum]|uniref:Uncharacterized protein n=1 Tax=Punica granatum TaxID=22663 RepID=A0A2I0I4P5_PUNGR|nr:hypothetical protein CRG98_040637 [Punica granatum]
MNNKQGLCKQNKARGGSPFLLKFPVGFRLLQPPWQEDAEVTTSPQELAPQHLGEPVNNSVETISRAEASDSSGKKPVTNATIGSSKKKVHVVEDEQVLSPNRFEALVEEGLNTNPRMHQLRGKLLKKKLLFLTVQKELDRQLRESLKQFRKPKEAGGEGRTRMVGVRNVLPRQMIISSCNVRGLYFPLKQRALKGDGCSGN